MRQINFIQNDTCMKFTIDDYERAIRYAVYGPCIGDADRAGL